jgi:hypothetical protein
MRHPLIVAASVAVLLSGGALAQQGGLPPVADDAPIYGSQMMSEQERLEHRNRLRSAKTLEERERIRTEHHEQMVERARERGVTLPDEPPMRGGMGQGGGGMGPGGGGMGPGGGGMGPGGGMGSGGRGR